MHLDETDENHFYWLVGLLEGEGAFIKAHPKRPTKPAIRLSSTDEDVVARAAQILNAPYYGPYKISSNAKSDWKLRFMTSLEGQRAMNLMTALRPHMSIRRQQQIDAALASYQPKGRPQGDTHPQAKLTAEKVRDIKRRLAAGEKLSHLALEYGVDTGLIWQIKAGRIWAHVE